LAFELAAAGYDLTLVSRRSATLDETARHIADQSPGATCLIEPADLTDPRAPGRVAGATLKQFQRIDAVANVAGYADFTAIGDITPDEWRATVDTNLSATVMMTAAVWPTFVERKSGFVVNVSSMASVDPFPQFSMYAACKAAVNMFTQCTAKEGAAYGIRAVCVAPGAVETPMLRSILDETALPRDQTHDPEHVAQVIVDCVTEKRSFEPGETILLPNG